MPTRVSSLTTPLRRSRVYIRPILTVTSRPNRTQPRVLGVVPARYSSRRFAGKPLALLRGKPLVMHVYHNACKAKCLDACVVATDDERIAKAVRDHGGEVIMTDAACETSLERCLEVVNRLRRRANKWNAKKKRGDSSSAENKTTKASGDFDVVVCIDADEPFVQPHHIETAADLVINSDAVVGTLVRPGANEEVRTNTRAVAKTKTFAKNFSPDATLFKTTQDVTSADTVKVVTDEHDYALLFSREPVPKRCPMNSYDATVGYKIRVGIQACRCDFLEKYATLKGKSREYDKENASPPRWKNGKVIVDPDEPEQNRVVFAGHRVKVDVVEDSFVPGVKTPEDLRRLNAGLGTGLVNDLALTFLVA